VVAGEELASHTCETLAVLAAGIGAGTVVAAAAALAALLTKTGDDLLRLSSAIMSPLPGIALLPLAVLWLGVGQAAIVAVVAGATAWPLATSVTAGLKAASPTLVAVGRSIGLSKVRLVTDVLAPAALPAALAGLRRAWAAGWHTALAAELVLALLGRSGGLGSSIRPAPGELTTRTAAALLTIALVGLGVESLFGAVERRTILRWGMTDESSPCAGSTRASPTLGRRARTGRGTRSPAPPGCAGRGPSA
jgi:NitT/TauT family transport system permease protein